MLISLLRTVLLYLVLILTVRLMGKRQIGEMEPSEFVVTMLIANLGTIPMQDSALPLLSGIIPILAVLSMELILAVLSLRYIRLRRFLCGKPVILIENGKILQQNLRRTRINLDELTGQLREQGILDLATVQYAILETNGQISAFLYAVDSPATAAAAGLQPENTYLPYTIVSDGHLLRENLHLAGRDDSWLQQTLRQHGSDLRHTLLLTVDETGKTFFARKEPGT